MVQTAFQVYARAVSEGAAEVAAQSSAKMMQQQAQQQMMAAFQQILAEHQAHLGATTKAAEAEVALNRQALETAMQYNPDSIVRGLADLQLQFGTTVTQLSRQLASENDKFGELQRAIAHQSQHLTSLQQMRVVADVIHWQTQEHQARLRSQEQQYQADREALEREMAQVRRRWQEERENLEAQQAEGVERITALRSRQEEDQTYDSDREQRLARDRYEAARRQQERQLAQEQGQRQRDWAERQAQLDQQQEELARYRQQLEAAPEALEAAVREAREEGIREVTRQAQVKAELVQKEWEGLEQGYGLQIAALEQKIERQREEITVLSEQLQATLSQAQSLALRAFDSSAAARATN